MTIDSDLDSVKTDRVRKHFQKALSTRNGKPLFEALNRFKQLSFYTEKGDIVRNTVPLCHTFYIENIRLHNICNLLWATQSLS